MPATKKKYDVGILGWWYGKNYGSILTYYGLNRAITKLGYNVLMVHEALGYNNWRVRWPDDIVSMEFARRAGYNHTRQEHYSKLSRLNDEADTFLVGSDQLWNPVIGRVNDDLFLDFVNPENRRIAYATSFGNKGVKKFKPEFVDKHAENLRKFEAISVRERYAVDTARDVFGVDATQVLDPVFLLSRNEYEALADKATVNTAGPYLSVFFLDPTPEKKRVVEAIADKLGLRKIVIIPNPDNGRKPAEELFAEERFEIIAEDAPENFLNTYRNAEYVVTDSFHGSVFAVIFEKPFSSIYNTKRGADRFKSLMQALGFGDRRRVYESDGPAEISENPNVSREIDFSEASKYLKAESRKSLDWLKSALSSKSKPVPAVPRDFLGTLRKRGLPFFFGKSGMSGQSDRIDRPVFTANNDSWRVSPTRKAAKLDVLPGASVRGNLVWCDLPYPLVEGEAYRIAVKWSVRTKAGAINLHVRNPESGRFQVAGKVPIRGQTNTPRTDKVDFIAPAGDVSQLMLGAVHFTGDNAGADVFSVSVAKIRASEVKTGGRRGPTPAEVASEVASKDNQRFVGAYAQNMVSRNIGNARAIMMFHAHAVEKGLSHIDFRPGFGKISIPKLAKEMNKWVAAGHDTDDTFFRIAASVMRSYFSRHEALDVDVSKFRSLFDASILELIAGADETQGGVLAAEATREDGIETNQDRAFLDVVFSRRSVREFTSAPVADEDIRRAVQIAMQAPSVCNRQPARVRQFSDPATIRSALKLQGGFGGYDVPPRLLLVTCDLEAFLFAVERNQAFIDGGLFMMTLLLGLEQVGLGACSLNTAMGKEREETARKLLNIPESEVFIAFIAVGHYDPEVMVCRSKRVPVEEVLV